MGDHTSRELHRGAEHEIAWLVVPSPYNGTRHFVRYAQCRAALPVRHALESLVGGLQLGDLRRQVAVLLAWLLTNADVLRFEHREDVVCQRADLGFDLVHVVGGSHIQHSAQGASVVERSISSIAACMSATAQLLSGKEHSQDCATESEVERLHMIAFDVCESLDKWHELGMSLQGTLNRKRGPVCYAIHCTRTML